MTEAGIQSRKEAVSAQQKVADRSLKMLSNLRLIAAVLVVFGLVGWFRYDQVAGLIIAAFSVVLFSFLVRVFNHKSDEMLYLAKTDQVLDRYLARYRGDWKEFEEDGSAFLHKEDTISTDLDLFGKKSLFQYLNIGNSISGQVALAHLLVQPALDYISYRQHSVRELLKDDNFIIAFEALGRSENKRQLEVEREAEQALKDFAQEDNPFFQQGIQFLLVLIPLMTILSIGLSVAKIVPYTVPIVFVGLQLMPVIMMSGKLNQRKDALLHFDKKLDGMQKRLALLSQAKFESLYLQQMQADLANAQQGIKGIARIASFWQMRENFLLYLPLCGVLFWDFQCIYALEQWRKTYGKSFGLWMDWIGEVEALASLGTLGRINPEATVFPEILPADKPVFYMEDGKHPLIEPSRVVGNDHSQAGETIIITGSNMSGKSTFMRTVALNTVLAYAGGVVNAKRFQVSPMRIFTSMRVQDNVDEGISTFYGEILRIKDMVDYAKKEKPMLVLIDEIFKGTNSADRIVGAQATIRKLSQPWIMALVTTHDFELCALVEEKEVNGKNCHFQEYYEGDRLYFDYVIRPGRTQTTNAKHLMRMTGLLDEGQEGSEENHVL